MTPEILQKVLESEVIGGSSSTVPQFTGLSIDSRKVKQGEIFFAIRGHKNDGHNYVSEALQQGAIAAVINRIHIDRFRSKGPELIFAVEDTHEALLNLAAYIRRRSDARFAAITGSNGKTTTKEMLYAIVSSKYSAYRSPGNLNNHFGLPVSLGKMPPVDYAIYELGISVPGEMSRLTSIIKPDLAVLTNIGPAHLETLKTVENVIRAKFELVDRLPVGAVIVLNADDPLLTAEAARRKIEYIGFSIENDSSFRATEVASWEKGVSFEVNDVEVILPLFGRINIYNALAAIAASSVWDCGPSEWVAGLSTFKAIDMRLELEEHQGLKLLVDCYNSNPESARVAINVLKEMDVTGRKIAVMGDMLELGEASQELHRESGRQIGSAGIDYLFCLGPESQVTADAAAMAGMSQEHVFRFLKHQELLDKLVALAVPGDAILFKASRGMALEKIVIGLKGSALKNN